MNSKRQQLASMTEIVADTGDLDAICQYQPQDATTNPSLLLKLAKTEAGAERLNEARELAKQLSTTPNAALLCDAFAVQAGKAISDKIPGLISTEVDARLSYDVPAMLQRARRLHRLYRLVGVPADRVLIKLATTWQGIKAAAVLEREGIRCNMTLLFNLVQAQASADAGVTLISPFVGRIYDWHCKQGKTIEHADDDPGVQSVKRIHDAYCRHGIDTIIMGASFRNTGQIEALAGCDKLTISPKLIDALTQDDGVLTRRLDRHAQATTPTAFDISESQFLLAMTQDAMASDLLTDGIRRFIVDQLALEALFTQDDNHARTA